MTAFTLAVALAALTFAPGPQTAEPPVPQLTVRGNAMLDKPADQLRMSLGVVTQSQDADDALTDNSRRMNDVVKALLKAGLPKDDYQTGRFSIQPQYARRPRDADADWTPRIAGYNVTNTIQVRTRKLELAGKLIQAANQAGANSIDSIGFDLADPRAHRAEAIATATRNARADAAVLAGAAGVKLVRILSIELDESGWRPPVPMARAGLAMAEAAAPPPIEPGDVTVQASVTIIYAIASGEDH